MTAADGETPSTNRRVFAHQRRAQAEVILEPVMESVAELPNRVDRAVVGRKLRQLTVLGAGVGAVESGEVDGERHPDDGEEGEREPAAGCARVHQNRK